MLNAMIMLERHTGIIIRSDLTLIKLYYSHNVVEVVPCVLISNLDMPNATNAVDCGMQDQTHRCIYANTASKPTAIINANSVVEVLACPALFCCAFCETGEASDKLVGFEALEGET
jgi:hypothetical protein